MYFSSCIHYQYCSLDTNSFVISKDEYSCSNMTFPYQSEAHVKKYINVTHRMSDVDTCFMCNILALTSPLPTLCYSSVSGGCGYVGVSLCVCERERERERGCDTRGKALT